MDRTRKRGDHLVQDQEDGVVCAHECGANTCNDVCESGARVYSDNEATCYGESPRQHDYRDVLLKEDIFIFIMLHLEPRDAGRVAQTCRLLYRALRMQHFEPVWKAWFLRSPYNRWPYASMCSPACIVESDRSEFYKGGVGGDRDELSELGSSKTKHEGWRCQYLWNARTRYNWEKGLFVSFASVTDQSRILGICLYPASHVIQSVTTTNNDEDVCSGDPRLSHVPHHDCNNVEHLSASTVVPNSRMSERVRAADCNLPAAEGGTEACSRSFSIAYTSNTAENVRKLMRRKSFLFSISAEKLVALMEPFSVGGELHFGDGGRGVSNRISKKSRSAALPNIWHHTAGSSTTTEPFARSGLAIDKCQYATGQIGKGARNTRKGNSSNSAHSTSFTGVKNKCDALELCRFLNRHQLVSSTFHARTSRLVCTAASVVTYNSDRRRRRKNSSGSCAPVLDSYEYKLHDLIEFSTKPLTIDRHLVHDLRLQFVFSEVGDQLFGFDRWHREFFVWRLNEHWKNAPLEAAAVVNAHTDGILALDVVDAVDHSYGGKVLTGSRDESISVYSVDSLVRLHTFLGHESEVSAVHWLRTADTIESTGYEATTGCIFASGAYDGQVKIWDTRQSGVPTHSGRQLTLLEHHSRISCLTSVWDSRLLLSGDVDGIVKLWDLRKCAHSVMTAQYNGAILNLQANKACCVVVASPPREKDLLHVLDFSARPINLIQ